MDTNNLIDTIEDAVNDSVQPDTTSEVEVIDDTSTEVETPAVDAEASTEVEAPAEESAQVAAPGAKPDAAAEDDFAKKFGLQSQSVTGRENRIPYSRVKKIVTKAEKDAEARVRKEFEGTLNPRITEFETKVKDYEGRLEKVAQFENILENDPKTFLSMLSQIPAYKEFFDFVAQAANAQPTEQAAQPDPNAGMPQPDQPDGLYSMDGLKKLLDWQAAQVEARTIAQVEQRYKPIEQAWQSQEQMARIVPVVEKQIAEARTWDKFTDLEPRIVEMLKADKNITLERAYLKAYQEAVATERQTLSADRNKIRTEVLAEIKKKPVAPAAPTGTARPAKPGAADQGNRSIEEIIAASIEEAGLKS
jgi:hypothetical protein